MPLAIFYSHVAKRLALGGKAVESHDLQHGMRLTCYEGEVSLSRKGVRINGRLIKRVILFDGEPARLIRCDFNLDSVRNNRRLCARLPLTYIDEQNNVCEGATGKIIFRCADTNQTHSS